MTQKESTATRKAATPPRDTHAVAFTLSAHDPMGWSPEDVDVLDRIYDRVTDAENRLGARMQGWQK
jgi:hypothetical protein